MNAKCCSAWISNIGWMRDFDVCYLCQLSLCCRFLSLSLALLLLLPLCWLSKINVKIERSLTDISSRKYRRHCFIFHHHSSTDAAKTTHQHQRTTSQLAVAPSSSSRDQIWSFFLPISCLCTHNTTDVVVEAEQSSSADFSLQILLHKYSFIIVLISDSNGEWVRETRPEVEGGEAENSI